MTASGPELLSSMARAAGSGPDLTQGAGGNESLKTDGRTMLIKTSGSRLREMTPSSGYAAVDHAAISAAVRAGGLDDAAFNAMISAHVLPLPGVPPARPSIETGFHSLLASAVIHVHSAYANVLNFSEEGGAAAARLFHGAGLIPYRAPGPPLCAAIAGLADAGRPQVFFLANHGLLVTHPEPEGALEACGKVNDTIRRELRLPPYPAVPACAGLTPHNAARLAAYGEEFMLRKAVSPDQVLYCGLRELRGGGGPDVNEVLTALFYALDCIKALGWTPRYLPAGEVAALDSMAGGCYSRR